MKHLGDLKVKREKKPNGFLIRKFSATQDIDAVYDCYVSGFHGSMWPLIDQAERRLIEDMMLSTASNGYTIVAEADGEARAVLIGAFPKEGIWALKEAIKYAGTVLKVLFRRYEMTRFARSAFWHQVIGDMKYVVRSLNTDAEITFLSSQEAYRGGIGRALVDAWVNEVRSRGYTETTVGTDSTLSWRFYEEYGFCRVKDFSLKGFYKALGDEEVRGYIYRLKISPHEYERE